MIEEIREKIEEKRCGRAAIDFNKPSLVREGFASVRSTLAGLAERGSETAQRLEGCKKTIPQSACADSSLYAREPENSVYRPR